MKFQNKIILIVLLALFGKEILYAQTAQNNEEKKFPNIPTSPSPNAYEMAKYVEFPTVDNYGVVPISIPIFSINERDIEHSIELNYHASGIKVAQEATWVGLGWNLKAGGVITRSIKDLADDETGGYTDGRGREIGRNVKENGWLTNPDRIKNFPNLDNKLNTTTVNYKNALSYTWNSSNINDPVNVNLALNALTDSRNLINDENQKVFQRYDCEPDIYYLSVNDIQLKFVFGFDGQVKLLNSNQKVKIIPAISNGKITGFEVQDQKGFKYYFGGNYNEETTVSLKFHQLLAPWLADFGTSMSFADYNLSGTTISRKNITAWFLYLIKSPRESELKFDYELKTGIEIPISANLMQTKNPGSAVNALSLNNTWNNLEAINHTIKTYALKDITSSNTKIHFTISASEDIKNGFKIDKIDLSSSNMLINTCLFSYYYMNNAGTFINKRLILSSLTMNSGRYSFDYYPGNLPSKDSYQQDFWGYYSTKSTGLIPQILVYKDLPIENRYRCHPISGVNSIIIPGSDRTCDVNNIKTGTLWKITYPTKGYTIFNFEPNQYYDEISNTNIVGGGLRIESVEKHDDPSNNSALLLKENYKYLKSDNNSSGILINQLAFATPTNYTFSPEVDAKHAIYEWEHPEWTDAKKYEYFTVRTSNNFFPLTCMDGHQIGYTHVTIQQEGNGRTEKEYYPPRNYKNNASIVNTSACNGFAQYTDQNPKIFYPEWNFKEEFKTECYEKWDNVYDPDLNTYVNIKKYFIKYIAPHGEYLSETPCEQYLYVPESKKFDIDLNYQGGDGTFLDIGYSQLNPATGFPYRVFNNVYEDAFTIHQIDGHIYTGNLYDESFRFDNYKNSLGGNNYYNDFKWGNIKQSGTNIFPFPPLSDNEVDELTYSLLKQELIFKENSSTTPYVKKRYVYSLYKTGESNERVFGLVSNNHFVVSTGLKATAWDAWDEANQSSAAAYFLSSCYDLYSMPKAWSKYYYNVNSTALLSSDTIIENIGGQNIKKIHNFEYNNDFLVKKEKLVSNSLNNSVSTTYFYPTDSPAPAGILTNSATITRMINDNMTSVILKEEKMLNESSLISGQINNYKITSNIVVPSDIQVAKTDGTYQPELVYDEFDNKGNVIRATGKDEITTSYLWSYQQNLPVAKLINGKFSVDQALSQAAYIGFESNDKTNSQDNDYWSLDHAGHSFTSDAKVGMYAWKMTSQCQWGPTRSVKPASTSSIYTFSGWAKTPTSFSGECYFVLCADGTGSAGYKTVPITNTDGKWKYFEVTLDLSKVNGSLTTISGYPWLKSGAEVIVDELRLQPADSQMETYSYLPMIGMKSKTDFKSITTTFDYDTKNRLSEIKNDDGKVLNKFKYHYSGNN